VPGRHAGDGGLALDKLGAVLGSDVSIKHQRGVVERPLGGAEVAGARHRGLTFSAVAASHRMTERRYLVTKVPRPGTVCTRPSFTRMSMARAQARRPGRSA